MFFDFGHFTSSDCHSCCANKSSPVYARALGDGGWLQSNAPDNDLLHPTTFEKASVGGVLLDIGCVALFGRILDIVISF
jgi:hypothetical protein